MSVAFYEHLPTNVQVRSRLNRYLSREEFAELTPLFRYFLSQQEFVDFEREFLAETGSC